jgi:hypothetical protein
MKKQILLLIVFAVSACARTPFPVIDAKLDELKGQPIQSVIDKLGAANSQNQSGDGKAYVWTLTSDFGAAYHAVGFGCTITVFADKDGNVSRYSYDGNVGGCGQYAHSLDDSYHAALNLLN